MQTLNAWTRVATLGLTAVLVSSTGFSFEAARTTRADLATATIRARVDDDFQAARYAVAAQESLERKYRLEPSAEVLALHRAAGADLVSAIDDAATIGTADDRAVTKTILRAHTAYRATTKKMFAAVKAGDTPLVLALDHGTVDPVFDLIQGTVERRATFNRAAEDAAFAGLRDRQQRIMTTTMALSALGLLCLGLFFTVLLSYQRRLRENHKAQVLSLEAAALLDNLTGIGNHRAYREELSREVSRAQRHGESLSLAVLDIDDFKVVNDRNGHMHGDTVLRQIAALLRALRAEDRAFRVGGDEFAVLLTRTSTAEARETLHRLRAAVEAQLLGTTVTIGLATLTGSACDAETLQAQAEAALYSAKGAGRNGLASFNPSMADRWLLTPKKIHDLRQLVETRSMRTVFQPIWDVENGSVLAYEALARPDPASGFNGPQEAFDLAERIGRAHELDAVCREAALAAAGALPADALLFINVSPQSLDHNRLDPRRLKETVLAAGFEPERIVIEITERSITQVHAVIEAARELQRHGFRLALDDTGAGNSGLEILGRLTFDFIKIDRDVIVKALNDRNARGVLAGIVAIALATNAYVIAEGIENLEMLDFVRRTPARGVRGVQGYLLRRPSETFAGAEEQRSVKSMLKEFALEQHGAFKA